MRIKASAGVALGAACLISFAAMPGAHAQTAPGYYGPQAYQGNAYPNSAMGSYGSENYSMPPSTSGMGNTEVVTNGPQGSPPPNWSASENVKESERYTTLLKHDRAFREGRMREECGPITDPQLHQSCIQSFAQYSPSLGNGSGYGSSATPGSNWSNYGR